MRTHVHVTLGIGLLMMAIYGHLYFVPWRRLRRAVAAANWAEADVQLGLIRRIVAVNLTRGLITVAIGASRRFCVRRVGSGRADFFAVRCARRLLQDPDADDWSDPRLSFR